MNSKYFILILLLKITLLSGYAQEITTLQKSLKLQNYSLNEGLSQSSVLSILQDKEGFLWFGTRDGLNKFDGHSFKTYRHSSDDPNSLSNSFIRVLLEDKNGNIWFGGRYGILWRYDGKELKDFSQLKNIS